MPSSGCDRGVFSGSPHQRIQNMRDGRGDLGSRLAAAEGWGGDDSATLSLGPNHRARKESLSDTSFWVKNPIFWDGNGNSQNKLSLEMKNELREIEPLLLNDNKMLPYLRESLRRNSASPAAQSTAVRLSCAPVEERFAEVGPPAGQALAGAADHRERCPWLSQLRCHQKQNLLQLEMGIFVNELPSVFLQGMGSELELSGLYSIVSVTLSVCPGELLNDETKYVFFDSLNPRFSEQIIEYKKMFSSVKSVSSDLQVTLGLLAP